MIRDTIKKLRTDRGFTQDQVARYLHIQRATYSRYETGTNSINLEMLCALADLYNVTADFILGRENKKYRSDTAEITALYSKSDPVFKDIALTLLRKGQYVHGDKSYASYHFSIPVVKGYSAVISADSLLQSSLNGNCAEILPGDFAVCAEDDSMVGAGINLGDIVVFRPQNIDDDGDITLILRLSDNTCLIRTLIKNKNRIKLVPSNKKFKTEYPASPDEIFIMGKMIAVIHP